MAKEETSTRRGLLWSAVVVVVMALGVLGFIRLRLLYLWVDQVAGFAVRGDDVVVFERVYGGEESAGGDRLVRVDLRTGEVKRRALADEGEWLGEVGGLLWFTAPGGLEARDFDTLALAHSAKSLRERHPALAGLGEEGHCYDRALHLLRFTAPDGRYLSFELGAQVLGVADSMNCPSPSVRGSSGTLPDGRALQIRETPQSKRSELWVGDRALGVSGLEVSLLLEPQGGAVTVGDDVLLVRRSGTAFEAPTELVRVRLGDQPERWVTPLHDGRLSFQRVVVVDGVILLGDGHRVFAVDAETGALRWKRAP